MTNGEGRPRATPRAFTRYRTPVALLSDTGPLRRGNSPPRCPSDLSRSSCGTAPACRLVGRPGVPGALLEGARPRPARARPARARPRLRLRGARDRRPRASARPARRVEAAGARPARPGAPRSGGRAGVWAHGAAPAAGRGAAPARAPPRRERDARSVRHHYDVSNEFFELMLGESMTYSCALWSRGGEHARGGAEAKLELVCEKLALEPGQRVLDIGCGWGSFAIHAASRARRARCGDHAVGAAGGAGAAARRGRRGWRAVEIRVADYRELADAPFDAVASIGMVEHVGAAQIDVYAEQIARMLKPGGQGAEPRHREAATRRPRGRAPSRSATCSLTRRLSTSPASSSPSSVPGS